MKQPEFEALAERILLTFIGSQRGYTPPENVHMLASTAVVMTEEFVEQLRLRQVKIQKIDGLTAEEADYVRNKSKINAIKLVKDRLGLSNLDAKKHVDRIEQQMGLK